MAKIETLGIKKWDFWLFEFFEKTKEKVLKVFVEQDLTLHCYFLYFPYFFSVFFFCILYFFIFLHFILFDCSFSTDYGILAFSYVCSKFSRVPVFVWFNFRLVHTNQPKFLIVVILFCYNLQVEDGIQSGTVCFSWNGNCCPSESEVIVGIRNCSSFFVYKLKSDISCVKAYCGIGLPEEI